MVRCLKLSVGLFTLLSGLTFVGYSPADVGEYLEVAANRAGDAVKDAIPASVELDRLSVILKKLDSELQTQQHAVATARIDLEDAEAAFQTQDLVCTRIKGELQQLRGFAGSASNTCATTVAYRGISAGDIRHALAARVDLWKQASSHRDALEAALQQRRAAYANLESQFTEWESRRELLSQRVETLRVRLQTQELRADTDVDLFGGDLARATELADAVERDLRIVEARQALGLDSLLQADQNLAAEDIDGLEAEVDAILSGE